MTDYDISQVPEWMSAEAKAEWAEVPESDRHQIVRRDVEMRRGIAINKDRCCGRDKYAADGFYGLELAGEKLQAARRRFGDSDPRVLIALLSVRRLGDALAADEARLDALDQAQQALDEGWNEIKHHYAGTDMTALKWLARCVALEQLLSRDLLGGMLKIGEIFAGIDPVTWFQFVGAGVAPDEALRRLVREPSAAQRSMMVLQ